VRVLVTGISGFIGYHTAAALHRHGHQIRGLVRRSSDRSGLAEIPVEFAEGDVLDRPSVERALTGVDAVVHIAGITRALNAAQFFEVNVGGSRNVVDALIASGKSKAERPRLVHLSSQTVAGPNSGGRPSEESDLEAPVTQYGKSKLAAEQLVRAAASELRTVILRPPIVYGPRDKDVLAAFKLAKAGRGAFLHPGFETKRYSLIHGHDLGEGIALALEHGKLLDEQGKERSRGVYYLTDGGVYTWREMGEFLAQSLNFNPKIIPVPNVFSRAIAIGSELSSLVSGKAPLLGFDKVKEMQGLSYVCSSANAVRDLGFNPKFKLKEGMRDTAQWYQSHGWL
jgi:nucleoside-diphosphate-sugar epimerase